MGARSALGGRAPPFDFLIPSRFEYLSFALSGVDDINRDGEPARQLRMRPAGWYGFALPGVEFTWIAPAG